MHILHYVIVCLLSLTASWTDVSRSRLCLSLLWQGQYGTMYLETSGGPAWCGQASSLGHFHSVCVNRGLSASVLVLIFC